jgi:glycosyltransferase involved in cell wall biosynthesis
MAAGTPIVVSDTGGLGEIVDHGYTGIKTYAGNSDSLAWGILELTL